MRSEIPPRVVDGGPTIRPTLVVLLGVLVVPLSLAFGLSLAFDREITLGPVGRAMVVLALFVAPVVVAVQIRSLGGWVSVAAAFISSGGMLVLVLPLAFALPAPAFAVVVGGFVGGLLFAGRAIGRAPARPGAAVTLPPRPDLPMW
jgi:hypothetical protein